MAYQSKTEIYLKVKKPLLERQRRARINQSLETLKKLVAEFQADDAVLRMDKAELLEQTLVFVRKQSASHKNNNNNKAHTNAQTTGGVSIDYFRHGYMNAVNEVSRVMSSTPGMNVEMGKCVMTHLGRYYNRLQKEQQQRQAPYHVQQLHQQQHPHKQLQQQQQHLTVQQQQQVSHNNQQSKYAQMLRIECAPPLSPASSGYHSDCESPAVSPVAQANNNVEVNLWRPW